MKMIKSAEFWCFLLLVVNISTAGVDFYFRSTTAKLEPYPSGQQVSETMGIPVAGKPPADSTPCHLVRYASMYCGYCAPKYSQPWNEMEKVLTHKGCDSTIVSPFSGDLPQSEGATPEQKMAAVSLQFIKSTRFTSTPITLLLDRDWKIVWSHIGVVESGDSQEALRLAEF